MIILIDLDKLTSAHVNKYFVDDIIKALGGSSDNYKGRHLIAPLGWNFTIHKKSEKNAKWTADNLTVDQELEAIRGLESNNIFPDYQFEIQSKVKTKKYLR